MHRRGIWVPEWWHLALRQVKGPAVGWEGCALLELWQVSKDWGLGLGKQNCFCVPKPELTPAPSSLQNRPSVITCASASARNCNLSHCPIAHSGCVAGPASYRRTPSCKCPWSGVARGAQLPQSTRLQVEFVSSHLML